MSSIGTVGDTQRVSRQDRLGKESKIKCFRLILVHRLARILTWMFQRVELELNHQGGACDSVVLCSDMQVDVVM